MISRLNRRAVRTAASHVRLARPTVATRGLIASSRAADLLSSCYNHSESSFTPKSSAGRSYFSRGLATANDPFVFDVTAATFPSKVMQSKVPVILDCHAEWCAPCRTLGPMLEKIVRAQKGKVVMAKLDTDQNPQLAQSLQIKSLPTVMAVYKGRLINQFVGAQPENVLKDFINQALAAAQQGGEQGDEEKDPVSQAETLLSQAQEALIGKSAPVENIGAILKQLADIPTDDFKGEELKRVKKVKALSCASLVRLALEQKDLDSAKALVEILTSDYKEFAGEAEIVSAKAACKIAESGEELGADLDDFMERESTLSLDERLSFAEGLMTSAKYEEAAEQALKILKTDRNFKDGAAKNLLFDLFNLLGASHDITKKYRRKMSNFIM